MMDEGSTEQSPAPTTGDNGDDNDVNVPAKTGMRNRALLCCGGTSCFIVLFAIILSITHFGVEDSFFGGNDKSVIEQPWMVFNSLLWPATSDKDSSSDGATYHEPTTEDDLLELLQTAASNGRSLRVIGGGWSWNPGVFPTNRGDGMLVSLRGGDMSQVGPIVCDELDDDIGSSNACHVTAGGGAWVYEIIQSIVKEGYKSEANGLCLNQDQSQSLGGVISTNVHNTNSAVTFIDTVLEVRMAHFLEDGLTPVIQTYRNPFYYGLNETTTTGGRGDFGLIFGSAGRLGVVLSAKLAVSPLAHSWKWSKTDGYMTAGEEAYLSEIEALVSVGDAPPASTFAPEELTGQICYREGVSILDGKVVGYNACPTPSQVEKRSVDLDPAPPQNSFGANFLEGLTMWDRQFLGRSILRGALWSGTLANGNERSGIYHDVSQNLLNEQHLEMEIFIPETHAVAALVELDQILYGDNADDANSNSASYNSAVVVFLRRVFMAGTSASKQNTTAASSVVSLAPSHGSHAIAVNLDVFFDRDWEAFVRLQRQILEVWREKLNLPWVRLHPGKFMAPGVTLDMGFDVTVASSSDDATTVMDVFYDLVEKRDKNGVFRSPMFAADVAKYEDVQEFEYMARTPSTSVVICVLMWTITLLLIGLLLALFWKCGRAVMQRGQPRHSVAKAAGMDSIAEEKEQEDVKSATNNSDREVADDMEDILA